MMTSVTIANDFKALDENLSCVKKKDEFVLQIHNETLTRTDVFRFDERFFVLRQRHYKIL